MRIITWNINSVRLRFDLLANLVAEESPDIICLQETKAEDSKFPLEDAKALGFDHIRIRGMKSYNGVAILSRIPLDGPLGENWCGKDDCRHVQGTLPNGLEIHNFYIPAGGDVPDVEENEKFAHKLDFVRSVTGWFGNQDQRVSRVLVGDLNIAPLETDVWSHKQLLKVVSHTPIEVELLSGMQTAHGWVDAVREVIPPEEKLYSWWSYRSKDWTVGDRGRRLDHVWVTPPLQPAITDARVLRHARSWEKPSDHVPVVVDMDVSL